MCLRPPRLHQSGGVQDPERGRPSQLRGGGGTEGSLGQECRQNFLKPLRRFQRYFPSPILADPAAKEEKALGEAAGGWLISGLFPAR